MTNEELWSILVDDDFPLEKRISIFFKEKDGIEISPEEVSKIIHNRKER